MAEADQSALPASVVAERPGEPAVVPWRLVTRIAFRFCFVYFALYFCLTLTLTSLLFPATRNPLRWELDNMPPIKPAIVWMVAHIFGISHPIVTDQHGSGDRVFDWVELSAILALAVLATIIWSFLDRKRTEYHWLYKWFRLFARFSLAASLLSYGADKVFPLQMPFPSLTRLVEPYGNFSPMGVLWSSIGGSPAYETFAGFAEMLAGILLIFPRTTLLGALIALADMTQVFMLNMTYDVPVKILSFNLLLLSVFLLAFDARRLANFFLLNRPAPAASAQPLFSHARANRIALAGQILFGFWLVAAHLYVGAAAYNVHGPGRPKSPLYGIWNVQDFAVDGQSRPPVLTDTLCWRRVVFDSPQVATIQSMDDSFSRYDINIDTKAGTFTLANSDGTNWHANFSYSQPSANELILDGSMDGRKIHARFQLLERANFPLISRGFHWVSEYPYYR